MWTEKYRPTTLSQVVGQKEAVGILSACKQLDLVDIPHFLFIGEAGIGKTSVAKAFANDMGMEFIEFNASKDRELSFIRQDIAKLARQQSTTGRKVIFLDEFDGITALAQFALRAIMEQYSTTTLFILAGNYRHKIIKEIVNRTYEVEFHPLLPDELKKLGEKILQLEGRELKEGILDTISTSSNGCPRQFIDSLAIAVIGGYVPPPSWNVREWLEKVKTSTLEELFRVLPSISSQEFGRDVMDELLARKKEELLEVYLKLGDYILLNSQPDGDALKKVVTVRLWKKREYL